MNGYIYTVSEQSVREKLVEAIRNELGLETEKSISSVIDDAQTKTSVGVMGDPSDALDELAGVLMQSAHVFIPITKAHATLEQAADFVEDCRRYNIQVLQMLDDYRVQEPEDTNSDVKLDEQELYDMLSVEGHASIIPITNIACAHTELQEWNRWTLFFQYLAKIQNDPERANIFQKVARLATLGGNDIKREYPDVEHYELNEGVDFEYYPAVQGYSPEDP